MINFLIYFTLSFALLLVYLQAGKKFEIYDKPNERSSHYRIVIRGGGIVLLVLNIFGAFYFLG